MLYRKLFIIKLVPLRNLTTHLSTCQDIRNRESKNESTDIPKNHYISPKPLSRNATCILYVRKLSRMPGNWSFERATVYIWWSMKWWSRAPNSGTMTNLEEIFSRNDCNMNDRLYFRSYNMQQANSLQIISDIPKVNQDCAEERIC